MPGQPLGDADLPPQESLEHQVFEVEFEDEGGSASQSSAQINASERACPWAFFQVVVASPASWKALAGDSKHTFGAEGVSGMGGMLVQRHYVTSIQRDAKAAQISLQPAAVQSSEGEVDTLLLLGSSHLHDLCSWQIAPASLHRPAHIAS